MSHARAAIDYAIWPLLVAVAAVAPQLLLAAGVPALAVTPIGVSGIAAIAAILERARPERDEHVPLDQPLLVEALHFGLGFELGYGLALGASELLARIARHALAVPEWPSAWPLAAQMTLAVLLYEGTSYWQHRLLHRSARLWRFHVLHHAGPRLNFVRAVRFHTVDIATASFVSYFPLVLLGAPDALFTEMGVVLSALGILQHANIRMRTPAWLDAIVCTPAVHRHHHSVRRDENDTNFGNTVMVFDHLFGTYGRPGAEIPEIVGVEGEALPRGFLAQVAAPFRRGPRAT